MEISTFVQQEDQNPPKEKVPFLGGEIWRLGSVLRFFWEGGIQEFTQILERWHEQTRQRTGSSTFQTRTFSSPVFVSTDPEWIQQVLQNRPKLFYRNISYYSAFIPSLTTLEQDEWKTNRKVMVRFIHRNMGEWSKIIDSSFQEELALTLPTPSSLSTTIEVTSFIANFTQKSFQRVLFVPLDDDSNQEQVVLSQTSEFGKLLKILNRHFTNKTVRFTDKESRHRDSVFESYVQSAKQPWTEALYKELQGTASAAIFTEVNAIKFNTTFNILRVLLDLAKHPEYQEGIRTELMASSSWEDDLPLTRSFILESLRLHTPVPVLGFRNSTGFQFKGMDFAPHTMFYLLIGKMMKENALHGPLAPSLFDPSRFLTTDGTVDTSLKNLIFGDGPRYCPGKNLTILYSMIVMKHLLGQYKIELNSPFVEPEEKTLFIFKFLSQFKLTFTRW